MDPQLGMKQGAGVSAESSGFTLVEILVVAGLVAVLAVGLGMALQNGGEAMAVRTAERTAAGLFQSARTQAVLQQARTRVLVLNDPKDPDRHLRYLGIVVEDIHNAGHWRASHGGIVLPDGVVFLQYWSSAAGEFRFQFPLAEPQEEGIGPSWFYYEFASRGALAGDFMRKFVIGTMPGDPVPQDPSQIDRSAVRGGFAIFPSGGIAFPRTPEDLK